MLVLKKYWMTLRLVTKIRFVCLSTVTSENMHLLGIFYQDYSCVSDFPSSPVDPSDWLQRFFLTQLLYLTI